MEHRKEPVLRATLARQARSEQSAADWQRAGVLHATALTDIIGETAAGCSVERV
jgi:hypothetical protein